MGVSILYVDPEHPPRAKVITHGRLANHVMYNVYMKAYGGGEITHQAEFTAKNEGK